VSGAAARYREAYTTALGAYLSRPSESALGAGYELGRDAVAGALGVLDLASAHNDALAWHLTRARDRADVEHIVRAAGEFFVESVSAFELVQRGLRDAHDTALLEQRQMALLRQLSTFLADASLAVDAGDSIEEILQLIAEQTRELIGAACCVATASFGEDRRVVAAVCHTPDDDGWRAWVASSELAEAYSRVQPRGGVLRRTRAQLLRDPLAAQLVEGERPLRAWLAAPLTRLDGREFGLIHVFDKERDDFSQVDVEMLVQLAQLAAAAIERVQLYTGGRGVR
jgi:hypothetical protein